MGRYKRKDKFYQQAKAEGHASRAFYKLEQIQKKYRIIKKGDSVVDLGCSPGGWMEMISKLVGKEGWVLGVDLLPLKIGMRRNMIFLQEDINNPVMSDSIKKKLGMVDVVVSDVAPSTTGIKFRDSFLSYELALSVLDIAREVLKDGGNLVLKMFPGEEFAGFKKELIKYFDKVGQYRPEATRRTSIEVYLVGLGFKR